MVTLTPDELDDDEVDDEDDVAVERAVELELAFDDELLPQAMRTSARAETKAANPGRGIG